MQAVLDFPVRVYYEDTDAGGVVYYANYLCYAERARTEFLRAHGLAHTRLKERDGTWIVVRRLVADYALPARLDDNLVVRTHVVDHKNASFTMHQVIERNGEVLVTLEVQLACINMAGRAVRLPASLKDIF